jgi:3-isopropylmalate/(R)-2-methylmalate dehydratase small subunit
MAKFTKLTSRVVPLPVDNVDTDQIIPARFLKVTDKAGLADGLFADWRQDPGFVLNQREIAGSQILLAGDNFGSGSSREHAPWALCAWGFRAIVSTSFADIFRNNALKNGLLPVVVPAEISQSLFERRASDPQLQLSVDLDAQTLSLPDGGEVSFPIDAFAKHCLVQGIDQLDYLLGFTEEIEAHERSLG